jgi:hypothetical protein
MRLQCRIRAALVGCLAISAIAMIAACNPAPTSPPTLTTLPPPAATTPAAGGTTYSILIGSVTCQDPNLQLCVPPAVITVWTDGALVVEFTASQGHCSSAIAHILLDGQPRFASVALAAAEGTGPQDLGPVSPGEHSVAIQVEGVLGGCNTGGVANWGGVVDVTVSAAPGAEATPRLETPAP